jgi:hypothetical protein
MAGDLEIGLEQLGMEDYAAGFRDAGFLDWDSLTQITEGDLAALNMRLGDRRKLQREIARRHRWPEDMPLPTTEQLSQYTPSSASRYPLRKNKAELDDSRSSSLKSSSNTPAREPQVVSSPSVDEVKENSVSGETYNYWARLANPVSRLGLRVSKNWRRGKPLPHPDGVARNGMAWP